MSGSGPQPLDPGPGDEAQAGKPPRTHLGWWWPLFALVALVVVVLLVAQPWEPVETEPTQPPMSTTTSPSAEPTTASPTPSAPATVPGADALFDASTAPALFVTADDLVAAVPAAEPGVEPVITTTTWGLPEGSTIDPPECLTARTVVATAPAWYDARMWGNPAVVFDQDVVLLADPTAALEAFRSLVTTVDACPEYSQVNPGIDGATWTAEPAIEGQGVYPSIVLQVTHTAEGSSFPSYVGHMLVGNTIVTWTAESLATGDPDAALATLGDPASLSEMVEERAQTAVRALG